MERILSFGGGVQTTALVIMVARGEVAVDAVVFADTGGEKPGTYEYMEAYTKPLLASAGIPFFVVKHDTGYYKGTLYDYCFAHAVIPSFQRRWCTDRFKVRLIRKLTGRNCKHLIGFSTDESQRAEKPIDLHIREFPLIDLGISTADCHRVIADYGWPVPIKSSCFFCVFQRPWEWQWLKRTHPDLFQMCLHLEKRFHDRRPDCRGHIGLYGGKPLWRFVEGLQLPFMLGEYTCWEGHCGH